ncbi:MAG TPA: ABC transporter substrate-binding protein [Polyangiaceae bacterium]|jgi:ABC-type transport system substrate-binding protein|nr:ABC transporter substrate-binding protein [Polyangiaceae bacterium]
MRSILTKCEGLATVLALSAVTLLAAPLGCNETLPAPIASAHADGSAPRRGGTLHLATIGDIRSGLDAATGTDLSIAPIHLLFAGLVDYDAESRVVPDLADHWDVDDDGKTYRFVLRAGVTMHDGAELTADDVVRSVERALHPTTPNPNAGYFENIAGYPEYAAGKAEHLSGVVGEGRYVVAFHLAKPDSTFPYLVAMHPLRPTCKSAGNRYSDGWAPCGAGPFKLPPGGWQRGTSLRLVRHDGYFRPGLPYLDAVEWTFNMQSLAQRVRFERGELDLARDLTDADWARFSADPRWKPLGVAEADKTIYGASMNTRLPPFDNVEIRRAVAAAIDREHLALVQPSRMATLTQALPRTLFDDPTFAGQRYDYAAALEHMKNAGYPYDPATDTGGWPHPIEYILYYPGLDALVAEIIQQDLAKIGLRLRLKALSYGAFLTLQEREGASQMSEGNWSLDYPDASSFFDPLFTTDRISREGSFNTAFYSNPRFDELTARAHVEMDAVVRRSLYREANSILCDEAPWAFTYGHHLSDMRQPYLHGFVPHPVWPLEATGVWVDRAGQTLERALGGGLR